MDLGEKSLLEALAEHEKETWSRRARIILLRDRGLPTSRISQEVRLSPSRVRYWIREFKKRGMAIFPPEALPADMKAIALSPDSGELEAEEPAQQPTEALGQAPAPDQELPEISVRDLCMRHEVDLNHARRVADLSLWLFDRTAEIHQLPDEYRKLIETAAIVHNVGLVAHPRRHHTFGRDILLAHRLVGHDELETRMLAFTTALHRKKYRKKRAEKEAGIVGLPDEHLDTALRLTAMVRIADGLDFSQGQTTELGEMTRNDHEIVFSLSGPFAYEDGMRAQSKADLWDSLFDVSIRFSVEGEREIVAEQPEPIRIVTPPAERPKSPGILAEDWMSEAGRKTLRFHFYRMLDHEAGTRMGENIEELHDMRVAVRRMRSAMWVFGPYFKKGVLKPYLLGLRRTGRALGRVRDLDVFMEKAQEHIAERSAGDQSALRPLLEAWESERSEARQSMLSYLDGKRYRGFVRSFEGFLEMEGSGGKRPRKDGPAALRVFQCAPAMIYERDRVVRSYHGFVREAKLEILHSLRIDIKRFRYTLEFFREVLGEEAESVIRSAVRLQDHLGELHDADVACQLLIEFLDRWRVEDRREQINISGVTGYLVAKQTELRDLVDAFPEMWETFGGPEMRRQLGLAVAKL